MSIESPAPAGDGVPAGHCAKRAARYVQDIWEFRHFWMSLVRADLQRRYRRSVLGIGWSLLQPLAMTLVLCVVYSKLMKMDFSQYGPHLLTGFAVWHYLSGAALMGCSSLVMGEGYIRQQSMPLAIFPLRTVLTVGFHFLISLGLALAFVWVVNGPGNLPALVGLIPALVLLFLFGWSLCILTGFAHVYFPDTQHLVDVALQVLFFMTPIMYQAKMLEEVGLAPLTRFNPAARLITLVRTPILEATIPSLYTYSLSALLVGLTMAFAILVLVRYERRVVFAF